MNKLNLRNLTIKRLLSTKLTNKPKLILGIESSCDDTCAAVLDTNRNILSNVKSSQIKDVIECGGVMTVNSIRLHSLSIHDVVLESLKKANIKSFKELSAIAITTKPGITVSLDVGVNYAKALSINYNLPLIPIHHMEAHALTALICNPDIKFPFLALLISGGHSQIALFKSLDLIFLLGNSVMSGGPGETIDKIARDLKIKNLGKPFDCQSGGESVEMLAKLYSLDNNNDNKFINLNRNRITNCNFNYGGIRNNFKKRIHKLREDNLNYPLNTIKSNGFKSVDIDSPLDETCFLCADLQFNLVNMFKNRLERAIKFLEMSNILDENVNTIDKIQLKEIDLLNEKPIEIDLVISGGVACNDTIMNSLNNNLKTIDTFYKKTKFNFNLPRPFYLCTDNATMIAWNGILKYLDKDNHHKYLLTDLKDIQNLDKETDARLGVDISDLVKKLHI